MSRYESNKIIKGRNSSRIYKSNIYPKIERSVTDIYIITRSRSFSKQIL